MMVNRLCALEAEGQAVWLDYLDRSFLAEGGFARLIEQDGVTGVTSNPSIFEKAIGHGSEYDEDIAALVRDGDLSLTQICEHLAITDIQAAADALAACLRSAGRRRWLCKHRSHALPGRLDPGDDR